MQGNEGSRKLLIDQQSVGSKDQNVTSFLQPGGDSIYIFRCLDLTSKLLQFPSKASQKIFGYRMA